MADLRALREAVARQISSNVAGHTSGMLRASAVFTDSINAPCAEVSVGPVDWDQSESDGVGMDRISMKVTVFVAKVSERTAQNALDAYLSSSGASSIKAALEANRKLRTDPSDPATGLCERLRVLGNSEPGTATVGGIEYLAVEFNLLAVCSPD